MSENIEVGDLVMLVRCHLCVIERAVGVPFVVTSIVNAVNGGYSCPKCGTRNAGPDEPSATGHTAKSHFPLSWLKKIDPLSEPTEIKQAVEA